MDRLLRSIGQRQGQDAYAGVLSHLVLGVQLAAVLVMFSGCVGRETVPLANTFESPEQLAAAVATGLEQQDSDRLQSLALSEEEFKSHVWPRLPISRQERGVPFGFAWTQLHQKSDAYLQTTLARFGGVRLDVLDVRFKGGTTDYGAFVVSRDTEVVVRDEEGQERAVRLFGSILEQHGRYKLFSYVVD